MYTVGSRLLVYTVSSRLLVYTVSSLLLVYTVSSRLCLLVTVNLLVWSALFWSSSNGQPCSVVMQRFLSLLVTQS